MRPVNICIGHDDDFPIAKFAVIKFISNSGSTCRNEILNLSIA